MLFRYRRYRIVPGKTASFNDFFREWLLPIQQRYGAQLIGRWQTEDGAEIVAIWAYASMEAYRTIEAQVRADPQSVAAQEHRRRHLDPLVSATEQQFMSSTVPLGVTALAQLGAETPARRAPQGDGGE